MKTEQKHLPLSLHQERVRILYTNTRDGLLTYYAWWISIILALFVSDANTTALIVLAATIVLASFVQRRLQKAFFNAEVIEDVNVWERRQTIVSSIEGFIVSAGAMFILDLDQPLVVYVIVFLIVVAAYSAVLALVSSIQTYYGWMIVLLMPLAVKLGLSENSLYIIIAILIPLASVFTASFLAKNLHEEFLRSLQLRFENAELLKTVQAEKSRAEKANTDKSRFLAATSHDLRQPLHALDLFLGGLKNRLREPDAVELLLQAQASSGALRELLNALLDVSRLDAGDVKAQIEKVQLMPIMRECYTEFLPIAQAKGLELRLRANPDFCVKTDALLLARMLRNLIGNAIRYTDSGVILIGARKKGKEVSIAVWDTGKGISEQQQAHIFDEYYQVGNPERDSEKGLGLGLAIVKRLSELLQHPIGFTSEVGKGSCFYISAPYCECALVDTAPLDANKPEDTLAGLFVLVVDDHQAILNGMRNLLRDWGCEVLLGEGKEDVLRELQDYDYPAPDVMIVDYRLRGDETGVTVIQAIRSHFDADVPAILMTGEAMHDVEIIAAENNATLVRKPLSSDALKQLLHTYQSQ